MNNDPAQITEFLRLVIEALEAAEVEYLIGGAIASWAWGEPRGTMDVDLVIDIPVESAQRLSSELETRDMLVPAEIIVENILEDRLDIPINAIHMSSGLKADLYLVRPGDELRRIAFQRRLKVNFGHPIGEVYVHTPEDLIIYKLMYFGISLQTKHSRDIAAILRSQKQKLDLQYISEWAQRMGLSAIWEEMLKD